MNFPPTTSYTLVRVAGGAWSVRSIAEAETFHPVIGPSEEAEALYVRQLRLRSRVSETGEPFVLWDVGLGAAANALTSIRSIAEQAAMDGTRKRLRVVSFDRTSDAASFALRHATELSYPLGFETVLAELISQRRTTVRLPGLEADWTLELGDFPSFLGQRTRGEGGSRADVPRAILFDPYSPMKNPQMWTTALFSDLFRALDRERPCVLATYTRSTLARVAMLLGGFFVGAGHASGLKEETTAAANRLDQLDEPLGRRWLERARRSDSAEPLRDSHYRTVPLSEETWQRLCEHPQFV